MKRICLVLTLLCLLGLSLCARADGLRVDFYDMGKADALLITTPGGKRVLIDTGTNKGGKNLVSLFEEAGVDHIDMLLITHYDKDHVGGADSILEALPVDTVVMPVYDKESKQYEQFIQALEEAPGVSVHPMQTGETAAFESGDGVYMTVTAAHRTSYGPDEENDFSLAVRLSYGETRFLFAGDAEAPRQLELLKEGDVACDVLKVPYHGRMTAASETFLQAAAPQIAFITDSDKEPASDEIVRLLQALGTDVRCAKDGGISVLSDGHTVRIL